MSGLTEARKHGPPIRRLALVVSRVGRVVVHEDDPDSLDTRRYRSPRTLAERPNKTMVGAVHQAKYPDGARAVKAAAVACERIGCLQARRPASQKAWFKEQLKRSDAPFKFVATAVPFTAAAQILMQLSKRALNCSSSF